MTENSKKDIENLNYEAKEAANLIMSMQKTLLSAKKELKEVFSEMEKEKEELDISEVPS